MAINKTNFNKKSSSLSKSNDKKGELLIKVDELMNKLDDEYGPFLLQELQKRLEATIEEFHSDLKSTLDQSFKNYDLNLNRSGVITNKDKSSSDTPTFIAEYEKKIKNKKK